MEYLGKGHDSRTEALSSLTSSPFSLYLPLMQYAFFLQNYTFFPSHFLQAFISYIK